MIDRSLIASFAQRFAAIDRDNLDILEQILDILDETASRGFEALRKNNNTQICIISNQPC